MSEVEPWLIDYIPDKGSLAIDVGANVGAWSKFLMGRFDSVYAFEPNPQCFSYLRNIQNPILTVFECALANNLGLTQIQLRMYTQSAHASLVSRRPLDVPEDTWVQSVAVPCISLDILDTPPPDFIKIDVEGSEVEVLRGASDTLETFKPQILVENHSWDNRNEVESLLRGFGYSTVAIPHPHEGVPRGHCWTYAHSDKIKLSVPAADNVKVVQEVG